MWYIGVLAGLFIGGITQSLPAAIILSLLGGVITHFAMRSPPPASSGVPAPRATPATRSNPATPGPQTGTQPLELADLQRQIAALELRLQAVEAQLAEGFSEPIANFDLPPTADKITGALNTEALATAPPAEEPSFATAAKTSDTRTIPLPEPEEIKAPPIAPPATPAAAVETSVRQEKPAEPLVLPVPPTVETKPQALPSFTPRVASATTGGAKPSQPAKPATPTIPFKDRLPEPVRKLIYGVNTLVQIGVLILFLGFAFLLRFAAEHITFPIELRYAAVALAGGVLLALGWFLRKRRRDYALILQGMGVGVFYLTALSAMKLHSLISPELGFSFLFAVSILGALLAILQNAPILAIIAALEGFATPLLVSTGSNPMMALFTYLIILDLGIALIAWFNAWRILNVIGFVGTFTLASGWANQYYSNDQYAPVQAFLIALFLLFTAIGVFFARRTLLNARGAARPDDTLAEQASATLAQVGRVDSALVFGTPLTAFGLQYLLSKPFEYGPAFSALALGAFYLMLARLIFSRERRGLALLAEAYAIVGVIFGTLAIPLGLEGLWTGAAWAVEGAGMYWLGTRQHRPYARAFAYFVMVGASFKLLQSIHFIPDSDGPLLGGSTIGPVLLAVSAFTIWRQHSCAKSDENALWETIPNQLVLWLGMAALTLLPWQWFPAPAAAAATTALATLTYVIGRKLKPDAFVHIIGTMQAFSLFAAICKLVATTHANPAADGALLSGTTISPVLLAASTWVIYQQYRRTVRNGDPLWEAVPARLLAWLGMAALTILPWQWLDPQLAAAATATISAVTYFASRRSGTGVFAGIVSALQALSVISFGITLHRSADPLINGALEGGIQGIFAALVIAASILLTAGWNMASARRKALDEGLPPDWSAANSLAVAVGTGLLHLAMLFGISLAQAAIVWPITACAVLWVALRLSHRPLAGVAAALQLFAAGLYWLAPDAAATPTPPAFAHLGFWTPLVLALAAWRCGDWIRAEAERFASSIANESEESAALSAPPTGWFNPWCNQGRLLWLPVLWGLGWWLTGWLAESTRILEANDHQNYVTSAAIAIVIATSMLVTALARWRNWAQLAATSLFTLPALGLCAFAAIVDFPGGASAYLPSAHLGAWLWPLALIWHLRALRLQERWILPEVLGRFHILGFWFFLLLASREGLMRFAELGDPQSSWAMLGWVLVPTLAFWLLRSPLLKGRWPLSEFRQDYIEVACAPVMAYLLAWCFISNIAGSGDASPLPYLPLLNPLELGQWLVLASLLLWWQTLQESAKSILPQRSVSILAALFGWFLLTATVLRSCHHWAGVAWNFEALFASQLTQAALSITWSIMGVTAMLFGNRRASRSVWLAGAALLAVVVIKLFTVELADHGSLYRIVSFIGVGILLLVVGYFAPVPAKPLPKDEA